LQKSKKHLALLVSIRWTLFQTPTGAKRETVSCNGSDKKLNMKQDLIFNTNSLFDNVTYYKETDSWCFFFKEKLMFRCQVFGEY
jgi:hypothetical protein